MRNTLDDAKFKDLLKDEDKEKVSEAVKKAIDWVDSNPNAELDEFEAKKKELEDLWKPIITAAYGASAASGGAAPGGMPDMPGMPGMGNFGGAPPNGSAAGPGPQIDEVDQSISEVK